MKEYKINNFKEKLFYEELENGLRIFVVPIKNKTSFAASIVVKYGGRDISFKTNDKLNNTPTGIAHFLEHKMFERKEDPFTYYGKFGTDVNAATSDDYTCYYFIGNKCFNKSLKYLINWIQTIDINEEQVKKEQGIILEEASMYKDNPNRVMYNKIKENIFVNDPKKNKVIGTDEDIVKITKKELELCYNSFYVPNNMCLIVTGNVNPNEVINIVKDETKNFKRKNDVGKPVYNKEPDNVSKDYEEIEMKIGIPKVNVSYKINKELFKKLNIKQVEFDLYLHFLISIALGSTSEIRQKWIEEGLFTDSFYRITEIESHYVIELYADSNKPDELIKKLKDNIKDLIIDRESFEREKKIWIANEIKSIENPLSTLYNILDDILDYNEFIPNKIEIIRSLNYKTLETIKQNMVFDNNTVIKIVPINYNKN